MLARDGQRDMIGRVLLGALVVGLALAIGYAVTDIIELAAAAAITLLVVLGAWAFFLADWSRA